MTDQKFPLSPVEIADIETEARRLRAEALSQMFASARNWIAGVVADVGHRAARPHS